MEDNVWLPGTQFPNSGTNVFITLAHWLFCWHCRVYHFFLPWFIEGVPSNWNCPGGPMRISNDNNNWVLQVQTNVHESLQCLPVLLAVYEQGFQEDSQYFRVRRWHSCALPADSEGTPWTSAGSIPTLRKKTDLSLIEKNVCLGSKPSKF